MKFGFLNINDETIDNSGEKKQEILIQEFVGKRDTR
jgi:hypothetical protein